MADDIAKTGKLLLGGVGDLLKVAADLTAVGLQVAKAVDNNQKSALQLGVSLSTLDRNFKEQIDNLRGGFGDRIGSLIEVLNTGLEGNSEQLLSLINSQKLTNQDSKKTAAVFADMSTALGLNSEQVDDLAKSLMDTSREYRVSTSRLVDTYASLNRTLGTQALLDMGPQFSKAVESLVGEYPTKQKQLNEFANFLLDSSEQAINQRIILNVDELAQRARNAETEEEARKAFIAAYEKVQTVVDGTFGTFKTDDLITLNTAVGTFGEIIQSVKVLTTDIGKREKTQVDQQAEFFDSLGAIVGDALFPLQRTLFTDLGTFVREVLEKLSGPLAKLGETITESGFIDKAADMLGGAITSLVDAVVSGDLLNSIKGELPEFMLNFLSGGRDQEQSSLTPQETNAGLLFESSTENIEVLNSAVGQLTASLELLPQNIAEAMRDEPLPTTSVDEAASLPMQPQNEFPT